MELQGRVGCGVWPLCGQPVSHWLTGLCARRPQRRGAPCPASTLLFQPNGATISNRNTCACSPRRDRAATAASPVHLIALLAAAAAMPLKMRWSVGQPSSNQHARHTFQAPRVEVKAPLITTTPRLRPPCPPPLATGRLVAAGWGSSVAVLQTITIDSNKNGNCLRDGLQEHTPPR